MISHVYKVQSYNNYARDGSKSNVHLHHGSTEDDVLGRVIDIDPLSPRVHNLDLDWLFSWIDLFKSSVMVLYNTLQWCHMILRIKDYFSAESLNWYTLFKLHLYRHIPQNKNRKYNTIILWWLVGGAMQTDIITVRTANKSLIKPTESLAPLLGSKWWCMGVSLDWVFFPIQCWAMKTRSKTINTNNNYFQ